MLIEYLILVTCILSILLSISFILFVIFASSIHSVSMALTCHSSITVIIANICLLLMGIFMLKINLNNNFSCQVIAYCFYVSLILIYHSYYLQAFHRYSSVVYHNKIYFRTYHIFLFILILQWIFAWLYTFRLLKINLFIYNPIINICHLNWNLFYELFLFLLIEYFIPLIIDAFFYISVIKHAHLHIAQITHHSHSQHRNQIIISQEQRRIKREFKMLKRIIIFYLALVIMNFPIVILTIIAATNSQTIQISLEYSYKIILAFISCILLLISIFQFILTPSVKTLIHDFIKRRTNQVFG
ncbi:unnamed protein product [Rotaria sp. Silwood1]|nr:unnamed protein product [Rotaria sp. Silwood1]CAF4928194.1 unnamed protein product [Rotaria sp. Silwood1]